MINTTPTDEQRALLAAAAPLVQERSIVLTDSAAMLAFLFVPDDEFAVEPDAAQRNLGADAEPVLKAALTSLDALPDWSATEIEGALKGALIDELGLKPRKAFAPVRVAVSGRTVSPPLYESMELLGPGAVAGPAAGRFGARRRPSARVVRQPAAAARRELGPRRFART